MINTIFIIIIFFFNTCYATSIGSNTGLELPRFVSFKSNDSNLRVGPSKNYPILIKYIVKDFPLEIIEEHDNWRRVVDFKNNEGWVHKSLIKSERFGIIISKNSVDAFNTIGGKKIGEFGSNQIINLYKCKSNWCLVIKNGNKGWISKKYIWGIKNNEILNIGILQILNDYYFKLINFTEKYISWLGR